MPKSLMTKIAIRMILKLLKYLAAKTDNKVDDEFVACFAETFDK